MPTLDVAIDARRAKQGARQFDDAVKKVKRGAGEVDRSTKKSTKSFNNLGGSMKKVVVGMVGLAAAYKGIRFAKAAVKEIVAFETELANVSTMLDDQTMRYLPGYEKALSSLAVRYGQSTATLSKGLYDILSASFKAGDAVKFLEVATRTAIGGFVDTATTVDVLTTVMNAYGLEAKQAARVSDILSATVKRGKITFGELAGSLGKVVSLAAAAGLPLEQLSAGIATMTRAGIQADMAMTALKAIITTFLSPTSEAIVMAAKFGLVLNVATLQTIGLTGALEKLKPATTEETAAIFSNVRALLGVAATRKALDALVEDYTGILNTAALSELNYQKVAKTTGQQLKINAEIWKSIKRDLGKGLLPEVRRVLDDLKFLADEMKEIFTEIKHSRAVLLTETERDLDSFVDSIIEDTKTIDALIKRFKPEIEIKRVSDPLDLQVLMDQLKHERELIDSLNFGRERLIKLENFDAEAKVRLSNVIKTLSTVYKTQQDAQEAASDAVAKSFKELAKEKEFLGLTIAERRRAIKVSEFEANAKILLGDESKKLVATYRKELKVLDEFEDRETYVDDQANAYRRLYEDLKDSSKGSYDFRLNLLNKERVEYEKFIKDKILLDKWYNERKIELDAKRATESENFFAGFSAGVDQMQEDLLTWGEIGSQVAQYMKSGFADALMEMTESGGNWKDAMVGFTENISEAIRRMMAEQIAAQIMGSVVDPLIGALIGGVTGLFTGGFGGGSIGAPAGPSSPWAKGVALSGGGLKRFAKGDILSQPTIFPMSNGGLGLAGEAGNEALMPLGRDAQGRLSVRTDGGDGGSKQSIKIINVMDLSQVQEYLGTGDGERTIVNIMRRNASEIQEVIG